MITGSVESVLAMKDELAKLRLFKAKTHAFLDEMGIDRCVGVEGCRAGARSHLLRESLAAIRTTLAERDEELAKANQLIKDWQSIEDSLCKEMVELQEQLKRAEGERDAVASQYNAFRNTVDEWSERVEGKLDKALPGIRDLDAKLAAAERENERLREGIVWLECDIRTADIANAIGDHERWESHAAALLSPPTTQGEEVRDG